MRRTIIFLLTLINILLSVSTIVAENDSRVLVVELNDTIDRISVDIFTDAISESEEIEASAIVLILDTPGGGLQETFDIVGDIENSSIPINNAGRLSRSRAGQAVVRTPPAREMNRISSIG